MRKNIAEMCVLLALVGAVVSASAQESELVQVVGRGCGADKTEALKDAYRDAVERAVGFYVDAEQMVKNEELVTDQILTQSNAYIEKYVVAKEESSPNGLVTVAILADVRKRALTKKIRDIMPSNNIDLRDVSKNLHAQIVTDFKANDDAVAIVKNELSGLQPLKQLMKLTLEATKPVVEPVKEDTSLVRLWYPVKVEVDAAKYYKEFAPRWSRILEQIKIAPSKRLELKNNPTYVKAYNDAVAKEFGMTRKNLVGVMTRCSETRDPKSMYSVTDVLVNWGLALNEEYHGMTFGETQILGKKYILHGFGLKGTHIDGWSDGFHDKGKRFVERIFPQGSKSLRLQKQIDGNCVFCVGLITSARGNTLSGALYKIPQECVDEVVNWQHRIVCGVDEGYQYRESAPEVDYMLSFADNEGAVVAGESFSLRNLEIMNIGCVLLEDTEMDLHCVHTGGKRLWLISPLIGGFAKSYVKWVSVDMPKDDVAKIALATISVEE